jgi:large subunit ribosomal protein L23
MALFSSKKKTEEKKTEAAPVAKAKAPARAKASSATKTAAAAATKAVAAPNVLVRPRITEKAANMTAVNVYTFDVVKTATKTQVAAAVKAIYKVTPVKVNIVNIPAKRVRMRRKRGFGKTTAGRKAYVYLKKGEEIRFS